MIPRPIKFSVGLLCLTVFAAAVIGFSYKLADGYCDSCTKVPPFMGSNIDPNLLLLIDNSASMNDLAYIESQGNCFDESYLANQSYVGYFDMSLWYAYDVTVEKFAAITSAAATSLCASSSYTAAGELCLSIDTGVTPHAVTGFAARGNFLNWAMASKIDIQKKILTGGKYDDTDNLLIMESRGCLGRRFVKKMAVTDSGSNTYYVTLGIRPPDDAAKSADPDDDTTRIEFFEVTDTGFDNSACQSAITELQAESPNQGQIKADTEDCMGYTPSDQQLADAMASFNHALQECWYYAKNGEFQPGGGTVSSMKNDCEKIYEAGIDPKSITYDDRAYVCYGAWGPVPPDGYVGRCWEPAATGSELTCTDRPCSGEPASGAAEICDGGFVKYCSGNYNANQDTCNKPWLVRQDCEGGGTLAEDGWTDDDGDGGYVCVDQAIRDYCGMLEIPEVPDPSDQVAITGEFWNIPAVLVDSGVLAQLAQPLAVMKGRIAVTGTPQGLLHEAAEAIRMGAMTFNHDGSDSECAQPDPHILYNCTDPANKDGGRVIADIDQSSAHTISLVTAINDVKATSWTPLAEAAYNAIGYFTQNDALRINTDDFTVSTTCDPVTAWCQHNNILIITDGGSTADFNATVNSFADSLDGDTDNVGVCDQLFGSTLLDDLTYYAKSGSGIFPAEPWAEVVDGEQIKTKQNISTHIVVSGTLRSTGADECSPDILLESAATNGGTSLYNAADPAELEAKIREAFNAIRSGAASGSAASVLASSRGGEGAVYQALFWPSVDGLNDEKIGWTGEVHALLIDAYGDMYEDTNGSGALDSGDQQVKVYYDETARDTRACYGTLNADQTCSGTTEDLKEIKYLWSASQWLNSISDTDILANRSPYISNTKKRYIFTWNDANNNGMVDSLTWHLPFEAWDWTGWLPDPGTFNRGPVALDYGVATDVEVNNIINWIRGLDQTGMRSRQVGVDLDNDGVADSTVTWRLGDVIHSTPTAVSRPSEGYHFLYRDSTYAAFVNQYQNRRQVIYFGGNDGMLHAVNGGFYDAENNRFCRSDDCLLETLAPELGAELWAYVPYNLLPYLKCLTDPDYLHQYYVDSSPRIFDVQIFNDDSVHPNGWGTILVVGMRFGGTKIQPASLDINGDGNPDYPIDNREFTSAYIILDITDPENPPVLLAELSRSLSGSEVDLGYTTSIPAVVPMKDGSATKWYLILGSGPTTLDGQSTQTAKVGVVPLDWFVGSTRRAFRIPDALPASANAEGGRFELSTSSFVSDIVTVDFDLETNYKADAVYFGTVEGSYASGWNGQLFRLVTQEKEVDGSGNLVQVATVPHEWQGLLTTNPVVLIDTDQPITAAPAIGWDGHNSWIYVGTGRFFDVQDKADTSQQAFYGIKEPLDCGGEFTWETVEKTGTHNGTPGAQGLLRVDQIRVHSSIYGSTAALSCLDGSTMCLPDITNFNELVGYIVGAGCELDDPTGTDGWYLEFPAARERNLGQSTLLGGLLTFSSYQPFNDVCLSEGLSDVYGIYYQTGTAWYESVFGPAGVLQDGTITPMIDLGPGLTRVPNLHVGKQAGSSAFFQASTGAIIEIQHALHPIRNHKTGRVSWMENP